MAENETHPATPEQKFFTLTAAERLHPDQIDVIITEIGGTLSRNLESEAFIAGGWHHHLGQGFKPWPNDTKPTRYRFYHISITEGRLKLYLDPCVSYMDCIGSSTHEFGRRFGPNYMPNPLAISVIIETADEKTLLTIRNDQTDYKPRGWHCSIGGLMDVRKEISPTAAALRELGEETGIQPEDVHDLFYIGTVYNPWGNPPHPDIVYDARTKLTSAAVLERNHDDENELLFIPTTADSYEYWIKGAMHASVVVPLAAMLLVGRPRFGETWYNHILALLAEGSKDYEDLKVRLELEKRDTAAFAEMVAHARAEKR